MRRSSESPESGSARKRRRLSSPTYEEHFPITQEDMATFDELEKQLSQSFPVVPSQSRSLPTEAHKSRGITTRDAGFLEGSDRDEDQGHGVGLTVQEWSSSPPDNRPTTQERTAEDTFFTTGMGSGGAGFVAAASIPTKSQHAPPLLSGFASAASLAMPRTTSSSAISGFASAAKLGGTSLTAHDIDATGEAPPSTVSKYGGFGLASALPKGPQAIWPDDHPTSPLEPPEQDYDSWFDADATKLPADAFTFKTARVVADESSSKFGDIASGSEPGRSGFSSGHAPFKPPSQVPRKTAPPPEVHEANAAAPSVAPPAHIGFSSAASIHVGKSNWAAPSAEAMARAAQKMQQWEAEFAAEEAPPSASLHETTGREIENAPAAGPSSAAPLPGTQPFKTPLRPALRPMENSGFSPAQLPETPLASKNPTRYTDIGKGQLMKNTQFKSPLINRARVLSGSANVGSPLNPVRPSEPRIASTSKLPATSGFGSASSLPQPVPVTPVRPGPSKVPFVTSPGKGKSLGMTPRRGLGPQSVGKGKFSTPFKPGMAPGDAGRTQLELQRAKADAQAQTPVRVAESRPSSVKVRPRKNYEFFDLNPRPNRKTLASSGLRPQSYTDDELLDMGIDIDELRQMTPSNAVYYTFFAAAPNADVEDSPEASRLGPEEALAGLKERGCKLATQQWVTNHYGLILWKLAAMVCLEPEREQDPQTKRWCWREVMRQLFYRYERELNGGSRPALRLISTEDAPAACPMVLCVSKIMWSPAVVDEHGVPVDPHPELEITDGWYLLRAKVDLPLARAVRRGSIRVGTKLAVSGARLSGDRKEACEILEAYDNTWLELCGNSTHLAPWHAKLGFSKEPFIATLDSLTADGGIVPAMDLIVQKAYPIAYLEFVRNEDGSVTKLGPRNEKEELKAQDQWLVQRENAIAKIRADLEKNIQELEKTAERLYGIAGGRFEGKHKPDDPIPDHIENLYSEIVEERPRPSSSQLLYRLNYMDAGWLYLYTEDQIRLAKERISEDIERELQYACPPRSVRDFRVVVVKDARWVRKEPMRTAQITLWDPMRMVFSEGGSPGEIREGQRFLVTNLDPSQPNAWMAPGPESVVYLVSKKNARWTNVKSRAR